MAELFQGHGKFDLSYLDNVVVFSEGCDFPIDHKNRTSERNTRLVVRPAECELAQGGVEYCDHVVGLGKRSPAKLKVGAIIDLSISRNKIQPDCFFSYLIRHRGLPFPQCFGEKLLSSLHPTVDIDNNLPKKLPETISFYNSTEFGVDIADQMARK
ncbi:uncharacterized protein TNCV_1561261 [Trichonephila clavipes]|nr:uncharacterized protein TNCV_1561261 [Trichonephila clavipes]